MSKLERKGLTLTVVFEAESANYGESLGNIASLKKLSRGKGEQYSYISRQAIRYNIINQLGFDKTDLTLSGEKDKTVIQFSPKATIKDSPEIDLFGYMKTKKDKLSKTRSAVVRLSNAISLETYKGDIDFLTNKGLLDRYLKQNIKDSKSGSNISQSEIHKSLYKYTITIDLEKVGIDDNDNIEILADEKKDRILKLLDTIQYLYRDIKGRREDLKPLFVIGGVYDIKNPIFQNIVSVKNNEIDLNSIEEILKGLEKDTLIGLVSNVFSNEKQIREILKPVVVSEFFEKLKEKVTDYYASN